MKTLFWLRLRARGYSVAFLRLAFAAAPSYARRDWLLSTRTKEETKTHIMILNFSAQLQAANLTRHLYEFRYLLPKQLQTSFVVAWRVPSKLAALLVPFNFALIKREHCKIILAVEVAQYFFLYSLCHSCSTCSPRGRSSTHPLFPVDVAGHSIKL